MNWIVGFRSITKLLLIASLAFALTGCSASKAGAQRTTVRVYQDRQLPSEAKQVIREMVSQLKQIPGVAIQIDSVSRFTGKGIYFTLTDVDQYSRVPSSFKKTAEEAIYIKSNSESVYSVSNSVVGFSNAVYTWLHKLGFRYYFPDPAWHIIPAKASLFTDFTIEDEPDFAYRSIYMGYGYGSDQLKSRYEFWERANRMGGYFRVRTDHVYPKILTAKKAEFEKNPTYLTKPLLNGVKQSGTTFNFGSTGLVNLVHQWLVEQFEREKKAGNNTPMLSLETFDGPNVCNLPECVKIGPSTSDQFFYFTNQVAKKLKTSHPGKYIGVLAYNDHIDIPKTTLEDNIFVTLTTAYNPSAYTTDQLVDRWKTRVKRLGIYDYIGLFTSTYELPGRGLAGNYNNQTAAIRKHHSRGIVSYQAESTYGWIPKGLGHYLVSQLTWDASQPEGPIVDRFFKDCFPNTEKWIRPVFESWNKPFFLTENDIYVWFTAVKDAMAATKDRAELERIQHIALYLKYVFMHKAYDDVKSDAIKSKEKGAELLAYMNQIQETGVVASYAGINVLAPSFGADFAIKNKSAVWRTKSVSVPKNVAEWNKWIASITPSLQKMSPYKTYDKAPFIPASELKSIAVKSFVANNTQEISFNGDLIAIVDTKNSDSLFLNIKGGRIKQAGELKVRVYPWNNAMKPVGKELLSATFNANQKYNKVSLATLPKDRYVVLLSDPNYSGAHVYFPRKLKFSVIASPEYPIRYAFYNNYYIYVPKGTDVFYITKTHYLQLFDPAGKKSAYATQESKLVEVKVGEGRHGWWRVQMQLRDIYFSGIPPLLSRDPESFFMPD